MKPPAPVTRTSTPSHELSAAVTGGAYPQRPTPTDARLAARPGPTTLRRGHVRDRGKAVDVWSDRAGAARPHVRGHRAPWPRLAWPAPRAGRRARRPAAARDRPGDRRPADLQRGPLRRRRPER